VTTEANTLHNIYRNIEAYPEPTRTETKNLIRRYVKSVVKDEWPQLAEARQNNQTHELLAGINGVILTFNPKNNGELVLHQETMRRLSEYRGLRHDRILGGKPKLDASMWITLLGGTILNLVYLCFLNVPNFRRHAFLLSFFSAFIGLIFFLLVEYNYPFTEPAAIGPEPFQQLLEYWKIDVIPAPSGK
jgi:hypothetical protein